MILAYSRVSTLEQAASGTTSLAEQQRKTKALAMMRGADQFDYMTYIDAGVSGSIPLAERPAGAKLLEEAVKGDTIVASKLDRIFRSASDALVTVEMLAKRKVDLILIDMGVEPVTSNGAAKLFFSMLAAFAEFERTRIAERMTDGRRGKKERNGHLGGLAPYGFKVEGRGREATLQPVEEEQIVMRKARYLWSRHDPAEVLRLLTNQGFRSRTGKVFQIVQVQRLVEGAKRLPPPVREEQVACQ